MGCNTVKRRFFFLREVGAYLGAFGRIFQNVDTELHCTVKSVRWEHLCDDVFNRFAFFELDPRGLHLEAIRVSGAMGGRLQRHYKKKTK